MYSKLPSQTRTFQILSIIALCSERLKCLMDLRTFQSSSYGPKNILKPCESTPRSSVIDTESWFLTEKKNLLWPQLPKGYPVCPGALCPLVDLSSWCRKWNRTSKHLGCRALWTFYNSGSLRLFSLELKPMPSAGTAARCIPHRQILES